MVTVVVPEIELLADTDAVLETLRVALVEAVGVCRKVRSGAPVGRRRHSDRVAHIARRSCMTCVLIAAAGLLGRRLVRSAHHPAGPDAQACDKSKPATLWQPKTIRLMDCLTCVLVPDPVSVVDAVSEELAVTELLALREGVEVTELVTVCTGGSSAQSQQRNDGSAQLPSTPA